MEAQVKEYVEKLEKSDEEKKVSKIQTHFGIKCHLIILRLMSFNEHITNMITVLTVYNGFESIALKKNSSIKLFYSITQTDKFTDRQTGRWTLRHLGQRL